MALLQGVYVAYKKNGEKYYRSSITYNNKHISLGSFESELKAHNAYRVARNILFSNTSQLEDFSTKHYISFHKWVVLHNYKNNGVYIKNPIYLHKYYFSYFLDQNTELKFDVDDLFYYSNHKIFRRNGYLFVNDYGMQVNILSRYGIKNYAIEGKDYIFKDGDTTNFRYHNIEVINPYYGVSIHNKNDRCYYVAKIHINGDYIIGKYNTLEIAAIAYNKAVDYVKKHKNIHKNFTKNFIENMDTVTYKKIYDDIPISHKLINL
ncbi:hypothetical protein EDC19_1118 [Natranaerovirga hydrolytica]|uniref:AP2 domain-containing protein n=1 Tax=Natranaerovirga hydrolytica TaxID=680378 RepID=A0A4R1MZR3_9FIRM|nr:hypothetical protein [Natranaerovirga hydrolytica]TCK98685.1 hypothetical protein EDC19_1118 [Natranaerovirga hydrolytica]